MRTAALLLVAAVAGPDLALGGETAVTQACIVAYERADEQRKIHRDPVRARDHAAQCARECPASLASECAVWERDEAGKIAKLTIDVQGEGIVVRIDGEVQPSGLVELAPGGPRARDLGARPRATRGAAHAPLGRGAHADHRPDRDDVAIQRRSRRARARRGWRCEPRRRGGPVDPRSRTRERSTRVVCTHLRTRVASRFEATLGTTLDLTAATSDGDAIYVVGRYSAANAGNAVTFRSTPAPAWLVEMETNQGLLLSFDGTTLGPRWVTTVAANGVDDRMLGVGFDSASATLWAAGTGNRGGSSAATSSITRRFAAMSGTVGACDLEHPGSGIRADLVAVDTDGGCVAAAGYSLGSEARVVLDGTPWIAGFAARDSRPSLTTFATGGPAPAVPYGMLFSPTATAVDVSESGVLFGAQVPVRVEDLAHVDGKVVIVGTMGERFLDLTCETTAPPGGFDFFVGAIDPASIP